MGSPLQDGSSSCATWGAESPGSPWGISTPQAELNYERANNLPSGSWPGRGNDRDYSDSPLGCAYDPPHKRIDEGWEDACTGCGFEEPFARSVDNGDPYCKDCWYAHEQGLQDANMFESCNNPDGRFRSTPARITRIDEIFKQKLQAEEQSGLRAADAAKAIGQVRFMDTPTGATRPIARLKKRGRIDTLVVDLLSGSPRKRKQRAEELAESGESRDELRRHGERVAAMKLRGGVLSRNDRAVVRLVRLLL